MEIIIRMSRKEWEDAFCERIEDGDSQEDIEWQMIQNMCESASSYLKGARFEIVD